MLAQTYQDFEVIIVDDGQDKRADKVVASFGDERIRYIAHEKQKGCSGSKNTGIKNAHGEYVAFLDDDDEWMPEKLQLQMDAFEACPDAGFCFTGVVNIRDDGPQYSKTPDGCKDYYERALNTFFGFLSSTLLTRKDVFDDVGILNEDFPSHTDIELIIRIVKKYKGIGISKYLVKRTILSGHEQMGSSYARRIAGREMLLDKYRSEFEKRPEVYSKHLVLLAKFYRNDGHYKQARKIFKRTLSMHFRWAVVFHWLSMFGNGLLYLVIKLLKNRLTKRRIPLR